MTFACSPNGRGDSSSSSRSLRRDRLSRHGTEPPGGRATATDSIVAWRVDTSGATDRPAARSGVRPAGPPVIVATGLSRWYGTAIALDSIDLQITRGSTYGLIGPNGAGKTTIISVLAGLRRPTAGTVTLAVDRRKIALLVDTPQFEPWLTAAEVVDLARHLVAPGLPRRGSSRRWPRSTSTRPADPLVDSPAACSSAWDSRPVWSASPRC